MTNTELIRQEIERRLLEDYNSGDTEIDEVAQGVCAALLYFIDSLPDETVTNCYQLEEAAEGMVDKLTVFGIEDRCEITVVMPKAMLNRLGMIGYGYGLYLTKSGKNR